MKELLRRLKDMRMIEVSLESVEGRPVVMLPDGDFFEQTGELSSFLMHLGILMPNCELPDKFVITTRTEIEQIRHDERERIQKYIDENNIYQVELGHYEGIKWIPLKTKKVNLMEVIK